MYNSFSDHARNVMRSANREAQRLCHECVGPEHLLLGLIQDNSGAGFRILGMEGITAGQIRAEIEGLVKPGPDVVTMGKLPRTPDARRVLEYAVQEARALNLDYVGTEHLLLGLLREDGAARQVLINLGVDLARVRRSIMIYLAPEQWK